MGGLIHYKKAVSHLELIAHHWSRAGTELQSSWAQGHPTFTKQLPIISQLEIQDDPSPSLDGCRTIYNYHIGSIRQRFRFYATKDDVSND